MPRDLSECLSDCLSDSPDPRCSAPAGLPVGLPVGMGVGMGVGLPVGNPRDYLTLPNQTSPTCRASASHYARTSREALELFDHFELLTCSDSSTSPLTHAPIASATGAATVGPSFSETGPQTTPRLPWKSPPIGQEKTDMSKIPEGLTLTRADSAEWLALEPLPGSRPMLRRSQRIVAVLELPCRLPHCPRPVAYRSQRLCRHHYLLTRRRLGPPAERVTDGRGAPRLEHVGYQAAHSRTEERHGPAGRYRCELCRHRAAQWALPPSLASEVCPDTGLRYSLDPEDYMPLCASCHSTLDRRNPSRPGLVPLPFDVQRPVIRREPWAGEPR